MDYIQRLPVEVIRPIFKHLSLNDLLKLRLVSKKMKSFCDSAFIENQIVSDIGIFKSHWFYKNERIVGNRDIVKLNTFIKFTLITELSNHLKRLNLNCVLNKNFKLVHLDGFIRLKHLEINFQMFGDQRTNLKTLKLLKIKDFIEAQPKFYLNCPKLEIISINDLSLVELVNADSVKYLRTSTYAESMNSLKNLEVIKFFYLIKLNVNILQLFTKLKQLEIYVDVDLFFMGYYRFKNDIESILEQKNNLNRLDFKLFFEGVFVDEGRLDGIANSRLDFLLKNYDVLNVDLSFFHHLNYTELNNCCYNNIPLNVPLDFFQKFFNICFVRIEDQVDNVEHLNWVLKRIGRFHVLDLSNTFLNQAFYDNLPNVCEIRRLIINEKTDLEDKLPNMFDLAIELFINSIYLKRLEINYMNKSIEIKKLNEYCYNLRFDDLKNSIKICENSLYFYELCESCFELEKNQLERKLNQRADVF